MNIIKYENIKPYRVILKLKNNRLWRALIEKWPEIKTQSDAARMTGVAPGIIGGLLNMKFWPAKKKKFEETGAIEWWPLAEKLWLILGKDPEYLFAPRYYGIKPQLLELEFKPDELESVGLLSLPGPEEPHTQFDKVLSTLTPREAQILKMRFGDEEASLEDCGRLFKLTKTSIAQIEAKTLRKIATTRQRLKLLE